MLNSVLTGFEVILHPAGVVIAVDFIIRRNIMIADILNRIGKIACGIAERVQRTILVHAVKLSAEHMTDRC